MIKIAVFIIVIIDNTVYYTKNKTLICRTITKQGKHIILLSQSDNYCYQDFVERYYILITDHQSSNSKNIIEIILFIEISFGGFIEM